MVSELEYYYLKEGYQAHYDRANDLSVIEEGDDPHQFDCEECKNKMRYIGLKKGRSFIAIAHCDTCGNEYEY